MAAWLAPCLFEGHVPALIPATHAAAAASAGQVGAPAGREGGRP
jgi:hypothetical protein